MTCEGSYPRPAILHGLFVAFETSRYLRKPSYLAIRHRTSHMWCELWTSCLVFLQKSIALGCVGMSSIYVRNLLSSYFLDDTIRSLLYPPWPQSRYSLIKVTNFWMVVANSYSTLFIKRGNWLVLVSNTYKIRAKILVVRSSELPRRKSFLVNAT